MPYSATQLRARRATVSVPYPDESNVYSITYRQGLLVNTTPAEKESEQAAERAVVGLDADGNKVAGFVLDYDAVLAYYAGLMVKYIFAWDVPGETPEDAPEGFTPATLPLTVEAIVGAKLELLCMQIIFREICRDASPKVLTATPA